MLFLKTSNSLFQVNDDYLFLYFGFFQLLTVSYYLFLIEFIPFFFLFLLVIYIYYYKYNIIFLLIDNNISYRCLTSLKSTNTNSEIQVYQQTMAKWDNW